MKLVKTMNLLLMSVIIISIVGCKKTKLSNLTIDESSKNILNGQENQKIQEADEDAIVKYLNENHKKLNYNKKNDFLGFCMLDNDLESNDIYLTGETHGTEANAKLRIAFLKYFKETTDFKYYIWESSYCNSYYLNEYLNTGETKYLNELFELQKGTVCYNEDDYNFWKEFYEYNKQLSEDKKIEVIAIDIEHEPYLALKHLNNMLSEDLVPEEISEIINELKILSDKYNKDNKENNVIVDFANRLKEDIESKKIAYTNYLGEKFFAFNHLNDNIIYGNNVYNAQTFEIWYQRRDNSMYENFLNLYNRLPKGKCFGQLGLCHVYQNECLGINWFAELINSNSAFKNKVLSIAYIYENCEAMKV